VGDALEGVVPGPADQVGEGVCPKTHIPLRSPHRTFVLTAVSIVSTGTATSSRSSSIQDR